MHLSHVLLGEVYIVGEAYTAQGVFDYQGANIRDINLHFIVLFVFIFDA